MPDLRSILKGACLIMALLALTGAAPDQEMLRHLIELRENHDGEKLLPLAKEFLKKYPRSDGVPEVRLLMAEVEHNPAEAIAKYRTVINLYRYYPKRDYAQLRICEIHHLMADWESLRKEARMGMEAYPSSTYLADFCLFYVAASVKMYDYDGAEKEVERLMARTHEYDHLARALLFQAHLNRKKNGYSRGYIYTLRELLVGFKDSTLSPSVLFLLGDFYEHTGDAGRSRAAYEDLASLFPRSPEASMIGERLADMKSHNVPKTSYYPDDAIVEKTTGIDISPDIPLGENETRDTFFAVSIGPFSSPARAAEIKKLLRDFEPVNTVRLREGFYHYVGKSPSTDRALSIKIRLAEELGINGNIVRVSGDDGKIYIYGEER